MATSPAGWRNRAQGAQLAAQRALSVGGAALRTASTKATRGLSRAWQDAGSWWSRLIEGVRPLLVATRVRLRDATRLLRSDLGVIAGGRLGAAASRLGPAGSAADRGLRAGARAGGALSRRLGSDLAAAGRALGASIPGRRPRADVGARVTAEGGDDLATILGRIDAAERPEVVLVVPRSVAALRTPAAWVRLGAHVRRRGVSLMVVASRHEVRDYAAQTGFVAARTWGGLPGARPRLIPGLGATVWRPALAMIAGAVVLVLGVGYVVPTAQIEVAPPAEPLEATVEVRVNPLAPAADVRSRTLPATEVQRTVRASISVPTTGTARVGDRPAGVRLEFKNGGTAPVEVPMGTIVRNDARIGFSTVAPILVEPGGITDVDAIALRPGTGGNVGPDSLTHIDDSPRGLSARNAGPARGGTDRPAPGVSQADVDRAQQLAHGVLQKVAARQIASEHAGGLVVGESMSIAVIASEPLYQLDEATEVFVAEYVARASVLVVPPEAMHAFAERYLEAQAGSGREIVPGAVSAHLLGEPSMDGGRIAARVALQGASVARLDREGLAGLVAGENAADAQAALRQRLKLTSAPQVTIGPAWLPWPWLPSRASRIEFTLAPAAAPTPAAPGSATAK
ncbi:MAG: baseplate J/gp47 family protein [Dehalococcoidia bacterium]|nr:baseplate J/gp47 family protein [Dehalococcoidia bacterium]